MKNKIIIQQQDFDIKTEIIAAKNDNNNIGAVVSFVGFVRDLEQESIVKMTLEHYPHMSEKALSSIAEQAQKRWNIDNITIIHRVGELDINAQIVLVITTSKHRKAAFAGCEFIIDYLKTQAPFWKKEHTKNTAKWVEAKDSDIIKTNTWSIKKPSKK